MSGIGIGTHDRGMWDREDKLFVKPNALRSNLTAKEAEDFARSNPGAEVIIKDDKGLYSVHELATDEDGKKILNSDFTGDYINLTTDVAKQFQSGKKAYVVTNDNVIRSLEIKGIELPSVGQDFVKVKLDISLEDKDGIETKSRNDLEGRISGNISISKELLLYSLAQASKAQGIGLELSVDPANNEYKIKVSKGIDLGTITLKMENGAINAKIDASTAVDVGAGLLNGMAAAGAAGPMGGGMMMYEPPPQIDPEQIVTDILKKTLSNDLGLKVKDVSKNQFTLEPDFKNSKLLSQIPVGDMNINLESVKAEPGNTNFRLDSRGDLQITLKNALITGSSDAKASVTKGTDSEGGDKLTTSVEGNLKNDMSGELKTKSSLKINVTEAEKGDLKTRISKLSGKNVSASGNVEISDVSVDTKIDSDGKVSLTKQQSGKIKANNLNVDIGPASINIESTTGTLGVEENGKKTTVTAENVNLKGSIKSPDATLNLNQLIIDGKISYDENAPTKVKIESSSATGIQLSGSIKDKTQKTAVAVDNLSLKGADIEVDLGKGNISFLQKPGISSTTLTSLKMDSIDLKNVLFKGKLDVNAFSGKVTLDGKEIAFNGKLGDINISNLKGSGKITFDPQKGVTVENMNISNASGKIGDFEISRLKGSGNLQFDNNGNMTLTQASSFELDTKMGLKVKGDLKVSQKDGIYNMAVNSKNPLNITYKPDKKEKALVSDLVLNGNISYDSNKNAFSFNNADKPVVIKRGSVSGISFNNFNLNGEINLGNDGLVTMNNSKGATSFSGGIAGINLKQLSAKGPVTFDSKNNKVTTSAELSLEIPEKNLSLSTKGNISFAQEKDGKLVLEGKGASFTGKFGNVEFTDLQLDGKVIFDPKTNEIKIAGNENQELNLKGKIQGKEVDLKSSGSIGISGSDSDIRIKSQGVKLNGTIESFNVESKEGVNGEVILSKEGKLAGINGLKFDFSVDGIKLTANGDVNATNSGYQVKIDGNVVADEAKLQKFFDKLSSSAFVPQDSKQSLLDFSKNLKGIDLKQLKYEDLTVNLDKNFGFQNLSVTAKEINVNIPERKLQISSKGSITLELGKDGQTSIISKDNVINAKLGDIPFKDFKVNGRVAYDPVAQKISFSGTGDSGLSISGKVDDRELSISTDAVIDLARNNGDLEFSGSNIKINGSFDGLNVKSVDGASGKFALRKDGHVDLSELKFSFKIDNVILSNKDGSLKATDDGYTLKLDGDLNTSQENFLKFLDKLAAGKSVTTPTKKSITDTVKNIRDYMIYGDIKDAKYQDFTMHLDNGFNFKGFDSKVSAVMENTTIKTHMHNKNTALNLGKVNISADIGSDTKEFNIKNATISFKLTEDVKKSMAQEFKNVLETLGLKDIDITVSDKGEIKVNKATFEGLPIINIDIKSTAKFEGTKLLVSIDDVSVKGFLGNMLQKVTEGFGLDSEKVGVENAVKRINDMKINYNGGSHSFAVDLQDILYENVSEDIKLNKAEISNDGIFTMSYEVNVGGTKQFNPTAVSEGVKEIRALLQKDTKESREKLKNIILNSSPQDLSRILDRVTIYALKEKLNDDEKVVAVLKKLLDSQAVGKNSEHLREMTTHVDDDISLAFNNKLTDQEIFKIQPQSKANLIKHLADGSTAGDEEQAVKRLVLNSSPEDMSKLFDSIPASLLKDELDDEDFFPIMMKLAQNLNTGNNKAHLENFIKVAGNSLIVKLVNSLEDNQLKGTSVGAKVTIVRNLFDGYTSSDEENASKRVLLTSDPKDLVKIIEKITLKRIKDELDSKDVTDILKVANKV